MIAIIILVVIIILILASCIKIVPQANAYVVERLGAYQGTWEVGIHFKMPCSGATPCSYSISLATT